MLLPVIAWRNIWRNPTRSLVMVGAMTVGIWSLIFIVAFMQGTISSYISNAIENRTSHIQVHHPDFKDDFEVRFLLNDVVAWQDDLAADSRVDEYSFRTLISGMLSTSRGSYGVLLQGVDPEAEASTTRLQEKVTKGNYLDTARSNPVLLSVDLADRLKAGIGSKVVFQFQQLDGEIAAAAFRVSGIFDPGNTQQDANLAYVLRNDLNRLALIPDGSAHEVGILLKDVAQIPMAKAEWRDRYPRELVEDYGEISPDLDLMQSQIQISMWIMTIIFMLALIFGVINTMLMAVLERVRELGMLMAIGMNRWRVFLMILLETIGLAFIAGPVGLFLGWQTVRWLGRTGVDLSIYSEGLKEFGMSTMVYPEIEPVYYAQIIFSVCITAVLGAIYPALKAIRLRPVEALRKI